MKLLIIGIKRKINRISNLIKELVLFVPVLYKVSNWDWSSLPRIMNHWIGRMKFAHENDIHHVNAARKVKELTICQELLKRISKESYGDAFYDEHDNKWGESSFLFIPIEGSTSSEVLITRDKCITDKDKECERKEYLKILEHENYLYKQDIDYLFIIFKKHLRSWWT